MAQYKSEYCKLCILTDQEGFQLEIIHLLIIHLAALQL